MHPQRFRQSIRDYQVLPSFLESKSGVSIILALCIAIAEAGGGCGLILGVLLSYITPLIQSLLAIFSCALIMNLVRGRKDLSCHCGGVIGNHTISWWLVVRNVAFILMLLILSITSPDPFTLMALVHSQSIFASVMWVNIALPMLLLTAGILFIGVLLHSARGLFGKKG